MLHLWVRATANECPFFYRKMMCAWCHARGMPSCCQPQPEACISLHHTNYFSVNAARTSLRHQCFFCLVHTLWSFVAHSALVLLQSVVIPETVLTSLLLCHTNKCHPVCTRSLPLLTRVPCSVSVEPNSDHVEHVTQV